MKLPSKFYKYRGMSGGSEKFVERTVLHNEVYLATSNSFNDPFDLSPVFSFKGTREEQIEDYIRLHKKFGGQSDIKLRETATALIDKSLAPEAIAETEAIMAASHKFAVADVTGVYCLTTKPNNLLMWAHYADHHKGICLEFSGQIALEVGVPMKVEYSPLRTPIEMYGGTQQNALELSLCTKSSEWAYEDEWRLIRPAYEGGKGIATFPPQCLTGIIIGALAPPETVDLVQTWAKNRKEPLLVSRAHLSRREFALEFRPIS